MPQIKVIQPFKFAHNGYIVEEFEPSEEVRETTEECAEIALREGWATVADAKPPEPDTAAHVGAPENKDAAPKRKTKSLA